MRKKMWNDLTQTGVSRSETNEMATSEMFRWWQKLEAMQKQPASHPPTPCPPQSKAPPSKYQNVRNEALAGPPNVTTVAITVSPSHCGEGRCSYVSLTTKLWCGEMSHVLALADTGAEVTVLHSNINNKEATSQIRCLEEYLTPALRAKVTLTGNVTSFNICS